MLGMNWDPWQKEILKTKGNTLICTGRRVGKTTIYAKKAADRMINNRNTKVLVVSLTEDQAQLIINMTLAFLEQKGSRLIARGRKAPTKSKIQLLNGSIMKSKAVGITGNSIRGFEGDILIIDEASRMSEDIFVAAKPTILTTSGEIWLCSTPAGKKGYFYEQYAKAKRFKVFHISTEQVMKERPISISWTQKQKDDALRMLEEEKADMTKLQYGQEYLGLFLEDLNQFFPDNLIKKCMTAKRPNKINKEDITSLGVDIARMGEDESTFEIFKLTNDKRLIQLDNQVTTKTKLNETTNTIINLNEIYDFEAIYIDDEGIGVGVFDNLMDNDETKRKIVPINNSTRILDAEGKKTKKIKKEDLYNNLLRLMERGDIELLEDDKIFLSLKSVQFEYTTDTRGQPHAKIFGNYTHIVEGIVRAAEIVKRKGLNIWISSF